MSTPEPLGPGVEELIKSQLRMADREWAAIRDFKVGDKPDEHYFSATIAGAACYGLATALAWVTREYPERGDELAYLVDHYIANGGDDADLFPKYWEGVPGSLDKEAAAAGGGDPQ